MGLAHIKSNNPKLILKLPKFLTCQKYLYFCRIILKFNGAIF
jgi:hypothetical protein